nr:PREDICTED: uncharacterized protein LOC103970132 isoform X1 [Musa acuminata subsp. malaccensis]
MQPIRGPRMDGRPPLAVSPRRLRPRRPPPGSYSLSSRAHSATAKKPPLSNRSSVPTGSPVRPERPLISPDLAEVSEPAEEELGSWGDVYAAATVSLEASNGSPLFERGRFYQLYSARRNERLKRKKGEIWGEEAVAEDPGVAVELAKRRVSKKAEGVRKSMPADFSASRVSSLRSSLRCSKEMKNKNGYAAVAEGTAVGGRRTSTRSVRRL